MESPGEVERIRTLASIRWLPNRHRTRVLPNSRSRVIVGKLRAPTGFTLLEMLFVMLIVGLLTSLMAPRLGGNLDHFEALSQRKELEDQFRQLPRRVRYTGRGLELPRDLSLKDIGDGNPALRLPGDWKLAVSPVLLISSNGACSPSVLEFISDRDASVTTRYDVAEISCEITIRSE